MTVEMEQIELAPGDPVSEAWLEVHHAANRAVWGAAAQGTSIEEILDVAARRHELRDTFAVLEQPSGEVVGAAQTIRSTRDNTDTAGLWLSVHPDSWRRSVGTLLLAHCERSLRDQGCARIHEHSGAPVERGDAATGFALSRGYRQTLLDLRQDLRLPVEEGALTALEQPLDPAAYVVETAVNGLPEEWLEDRALLARRMSTTDLVVRPGQPDLAVQSDTLVLREHRGRGLGLAVKLANLRGLQRERPEVTTVRTWNADTNTHMVAINARMGFVVTGWTREWAKAL